MPDNYRWWPRCLKVSWSYIKHQYTTSQPTPRHIPRCINIPVYTDIKSSDRVYIVYNNLTLYMHKWTHEATCYTLFQKKNLSVRVCLCIFVCWDTQSKNKMGYLFVEIKCYQSCMPNFAIKNMDFINPSSFFPNATSGHSRNTLEKENIHWW